MTNIHRFNSKQMIFQELFIGTLIYVVVLGLLNDYTAIVQANSFSIILFSAVVLEVLTYLALQLKNIIIAYLKGREGGVFTG